MVTMTTTTQLQVRTEISYAMLRRQGEDHLLEQVGVVGVVEAVEAVEVVEVVHVAGTRVAVDKAEVQ